jgi:hypothetical protein
VFLLASTKIRPQLEEQLGVVIGEHPGPIVSESCHHSDQCIRGLKDLINASLQQCNPSCH